MKNCRNKEKSAASRAASNSLKGRSSGVILVVASQFASVDTIPEILDRYRQKFFSALHLLNWCEWYPQRPALGLSLLNQFRELFVYVGPGQLGT